jgi:hypothetical protein
VGLDSQLEEDIENKLSFFSGILEEESEKIREEFKLSGLFIYFDYGNISNRREFVSKFHDR